jgi:hypothetical protein
LKDESIQSNNQWRDAGKPRHGPIFDKRQACRLRYRKRIKEGEKSSLLSYTNELHDALMHKNGPEFWKCWRSKFEMSRRCAEVDGCVDDTVIANNFANHFMKSCSSNNEQRATELQDEYLNKRAGYSGLPLNDDYLFDVELVSTVIQKLKCGKAAGLDGLTAEHLIHCHPIISCILYKLFNLIVISGHVPCVFGQSYTIPIPKLSDCRTKSMSVDDFRGIAISPVISKIFEHCILDRYQHLLTTSDNQFGFKKGLSCSHAIYTVRNLVERFISGGSTVNICAIDVSKAFDKVNHCGLLLKLMQKNIPVELLQLLENWLKCCSTCVKWKNEFSRFYKLDFGVRQGSVLSPHLFAFTLMILLIGLITINVISLSYMQMIYCLLRHPSLNSNYYLTCVR